MKKELREMLQQIQAKQAEVRTFLEQDKVNEAETKMEELRSLQKRYEIAKELADDELRGAEGTAKKEERNMEENNDKEHRELFNKYLRWQLNAEERSRIAKYDGRRLFGEKRDLSVGTSQTGGILIPDNYMNQILDSLKEKHSVRNLVTVKTVGLPSGTVPKRTGEAGRFTNVAEYGLISKTESPTYGSLTYKVQKFAGYLPVSREMLEDPVFDIAGEIRDWLTEMALNTENDEILYGAGGDTACEGILRATEYDTVAAPAPADMNVHAFQKFALKTGPYFKRGKWVMNTDAFLTLLKLEDKQGRQLLQPDPRDDFGYRLCGRPIEIMDEIKTEGTTTKKTKILYGDFKLGYRMFARNSFEIASSAEAGDAFLTDSVYFRGLERFDGVVWDDKAIRIMKDLIVEETGA